MTSSLSNKMKKTNVGGILASMHSKFLSFTYVLLTLDLLYREGGSNKGHMSYSPPLLSIVPFLESTPSSQ